jgi:hypothetical protein
MPTLLRRLPFFDRVTTVQIRGQNHRLLPLQIVVWVSLGPKALRDLDPRTPRFPAVLDPAFTDGFLIHMQHLRQFAGLQPEHLRPHGESLRTPDRLIPLHAANVWLHRNAPGRRDEFVAAAPFLLELPRGIGITSGTDSYPRLPLLGARALRAARLNVSIDYLRCQISVRTLRRFWLFG